MVKVGSGSGSGSEINNFGSTTLMRMPVYSMLKVHVLKYLQWVGNVLNKLSCTNRITMCLFAESEQCGSAVWSWYENYLSLQGDGGVTSHSVKCRAIQWSSWDITNPENTQFYTQKPDNSFKGTVQRDFNSVFWCLWIGLGLNKDRFWF